MDFLQVIIAALVGVAIGLVIGMFIGTERMRKAVEERSVGWLRIDRSEPDEPPRLFSELKGVTPDTIARNKFVIFEVIDESYISPN